MSHTARMFCTHPPVRQRINALIDQRRRVQEAFRGADLATAQGCTRDSRGKGSGLTPFLAHVRDASCGWQDAPRGTASHRKPRVCTAAYTAPPSPSPPPSTHIRHDTRAAPRGTSHLCNRIETGFPVLTYAV